MFGLARRAPASRRRILVSAIEHKCVLAAARALEEREGFTVEIVPVDGEGFIDLNVLESMLDDSVAVASIMAVNNEVGTIQDLPTISALLARQGIAFHCDAAQAPCGMDVSRLAEYTDLISLSGHKIYGPQGIGALYVRRDLQARIEPLIYGGGQQNGLRSGTVPVPLCVGMAAAAEIVLEEGSRERLEVAKRRNLFVTLLSDISFSIAINGPAWDRRHPGNANLRFDGFAAQDILGALQPGLAASTGAACTSGIPEPSHVLSAMGLDKDQAASSVRFSFGQFTSNLEVRKAATMVTEALETLIDSGVPPV